MLQTLAEVLFPGSCPGCGARAEPVCGDCAAELNRASHLPLPFGFDSCVAAFAYEGTARELIARIKYRNRRTAVPWLADAMVAVFVDAHGPEHGVEVVDAVTWVPTTPDRRRSRGFDHAELLARAVGDRLRLPTRGLLTRRAGPAQTGRSRHLRVAGPTMTARISLDGRSVLVIDDVLTTGATMRAAAHALASCGARSVHGLVAAWRA